MVLATDMKQHFALLGQFNATSHRRAAAPTAAAGAAEGGKGTPDTSPRNGGGTAGVAAAGAEGQPAQRQLSKDQSQG